MIEIWMGSMIDPLFGLITIFGGLLLGFSSSFKNYEVMNKKSKALLYASFIYLLSLMSLTYLKNNKYSLTIFFAHLILIPMTYLVFYGR
jgi:hypothetical protein